MSCSATKHGGSIVGEVSNMAIPIGLLAARQGLEWYDKKNKKAPASPAKARASRAKAKVPASPRSASPAKAKRSASPAKAKRSASPAKAKRSSSPAKAKKVVGVKKPKTVKRAASPSPQRGGAPKASKATKASKASKAATKPSKDMPSPLALLKKLFKKQKNQSGGGDYQPATYPSTPMYNNTINQLGSMASTAENFITGNM